MRNTCTVLSSTGWLDDTIINQAQSILREQFGAAGFQNTTLGTRLLFDVIRSEFIQILHNGKNHWLTIPTIGLPASTVNVYDSLYQSLSQCTIDQICAVMFSTNDAVDVRFIDVEQQTNNSDCGVYAIAYATTSLCFSEDISCIQFCVSKMRSHLVSCLEKGQMSPFPSIRRNVSTCSVVAQETIQIRIRLEGK